MASVLSLADAKAHLNITASTYDTELQDVIDSAEAAIAERVGPLQAEEVTDRVQGGTYALLLPVAPAISLTSITPYAGTALTLADLHLDTADAVVSMNSGLPFVAMYYDVVYQAGRAPCPKHLVMAIKELVRHLWQTQRGSARRPGAQPSDELSNRIPGAAYIFPFRVEQLLALEASFGFA